MKTENLNKEELQNLLFKSKVIGQGTYGLIVEYDDNTLLKIYYKDIFETYNSRNIAKIDEEINNRIEVENQMIKMKILNKKRIEIIEEKIQQLQQTQSRTLIKGTAIYQGYPIGVFLENYKGYDKLGTVFLDLHENEQKLILDKSASLFADLYKNGIIPRDIKEDNILVRKKDLDVKLIDLDDIETRYEDQDYLQEYPYIRKDAVEAFEKMKKRLLKKEIVLER